MMIIKRLYFVGNARVHDMMTMMTNAYGKRRSVQQRTGCITYMQKLLGDAKIDLNLEATVCCFSYGLPGLVPLPNNDDGIKRFIVQTRL